MSPKKTHKRILLNKNQSGVVEYCETCDVVEVEMGPVSIRLQAKDLALYSQLIQEAKQRLQFYQRDRLMHEAESTVVNLH